MQTDREHFAEEATRTAKKKAGSNAGVDQCSSIFYDNIQNDIYI